jgi:carboxypeptidase T
MLDHHEVHLMLHTNPDGRKKAEAGLSWRKNTNNNFCANSNNRGVDLNRNFTFAWNAPDGSGSSGSACS